MLIVHLKKGRDKPIRAGHPWVFSGALSNVEGKIEPGEECMVRSAGGDSIGFGYYNPASAIRVRMLSLGAAPFSMDALLERIDRAIGLRRNLPDVAGAAAYRLINSEGDFLPGLIVDKYNTGLCVQVLSAGMERLRGPIIAHLQETLSPGFLYERSDTDARAREGLAPRSGLVSGAVPDPLLFKENGLTFGIDLVNGQKTGFFLDQRRNRALAAAYASNAFVCDCFAYSGAFSAYALAHGARRAHVVDVSKSALEIARRNLALNGLPSEKADFLADDVFSFLRATTDSYDLIILDPPKFAKHPGEVERAARGYKDINLLAFKKAARGGVVFTFSCSSAIDPRLFRQIVFSAAADSGRLIQVLHVLGAGPDHPFNIAHPEGEYLKGLALRVM
jgi:23S rRNA (cytosine1962-C5)-methyltransferase